MALSRMWRRLRNFQRWKKATTPMLLNADTGEVIPFSSYTAPPTGKWMLRRPLTLAGSTLPLFLETPLMRGDLAKGTKYQAQGIDPSGPNALPFVEASVEMVRLSQ
jgi:hypothetical protein